MQLLDNSVEAAEAETVIRAEALQERVRCKQLPHYDLLRPVLQHSRGSPQLPLETNTNTLYTCTTVSRKRKGEECCDDDGTTEYGGIADNRKRIRVLVRRRTAAAGQSEAQPLFYIYGDLLLIPRYKWGGGGGRGRRRSPPVPDLSTPIDASSTLEPPHAQRSRIQPLYDVQECSQSLEEGGFTQDWFSNIMQPVMRDLNAYGVCVVDEFLGAERAEQILNEVKVLHSRGVFEDGQVVSRQVQDRARGMIRGDKIAWVTGGEPQCGGVGQLMRVVDTVVSKCNQHADAGKLANYNITWRTRAMVACYPGRDTQYVKHVDNPNGDGRCITAIYYLNQGWTEKDGGVLRIYPEGCSDKIAAIEPKFDRMLFFWSDRRNPHEVLPSKFTRYAITVWYLDQKEREEFLARQCLANVPHTPPHPSSDPQ